MPQVLKLMLNASLYNIHIRSSVKLWLKEGYSQLSVGSTTFRNEYCFIEFAHKLSISSLSLCVKV